MGALGAMGAMGALGAMGAMGATRSAHGTRSGLTRRSAWPSTNVKLASADDGGYPWVGASQLDTNVLLYDWGYGTCPTNDTGCYSLPYPSPPPNATAGMADPWVYNLRNCTSYVAWKIKQVFGADINGWGDAKDWDANATGPGHPYTNDSTPQVGDIAQWTTGGGGFGHVAYVYAVSGTTASLAEYNSGLPRDNTPQHNLQWGLFDNSRTSVTAGAPDHYIHIGTITPPPTNLDFNGDGYADLAIVNTASTGSGYVEVHPLSGINTFSTWIGHYTTIAAYLNSTQQVLAGDVNNDIHPDAVIVNTSSTSSGYIEVHPLSGLTNFTTWVGHYATPAAYLTSNQQLVMGDFNNDGYADLAIVNTASTGSGYIEVHILSGITHFTTWLGHFVTPANYLNSRGRFRTRRKW
jgi:surface antigen